MAARKQKPPVPGAVRCYRLAHESHEDAFAFAAGALRRRGWTPVEEDYKIVRVGTGPYFHVTLWAVPPKREEQAEAVA